MLMSYSIKKILLSRTYLLSCVQATRAYFILFFFISVNEVKFMFVTGLFRLSVYRFLIFALVFHLRQSYANSSKFFITKGFLPKVANKYFSSIERKLSKFDLLCSVLNAVLFFNQRFQFKEPVSPKVLCAPKYIFHIGKIFHI